LGRLTGDVSRGLETFIFSLAVLSDSTIISGDNRGHLQFWDGVAGVLACSFNLNGTDINSIVASDDEDTVFAAGTDSKVVCIKRSRLGKSSSLPAGESAPEPQHRRGVYTSAQRPHTHDVFALAVCSAAGRPRLLSGGIDTKLCTYGISEFGMNRPSWILPVPATGIVSADAAASTMVVAHRTHLDVWRFESEENFSRKRTNSEMMNDAISKELNLVGRLSLKGIDHVKRCIISSDGKLLAVCFSVGVRLWKLSILKDTSDFFIKLDIPELEQLSCHAFSFSPDCCRFSVALANGCIYLGDILDMTKSSKIQHTFNHHSNVTASMSLNASSVHTALEYVVKDTAFSPDNHWLAVSSCAAKLYVYGIDSGRIDWILPAFSSPITHSSFSPNGTLYVVTSDNLFFSFDVQTHQRSQWSSKNSSLIPQVVKSLPGPIESLTYDVRNENILFLYGQGFVVYVDLLLDIPAKPKLLQTASACHRDSSFRSGKSKHPQNPNFSICTQYRSIVYAATLDSELVSNFTFILKLILGPIRLLLSPHILATKFIPHKK